MQYLQEIVALSNDVGYKATALNLLGCICAKLVLNRVYFTDCTKNQKIIICMVSKLKISQNVGEMVSLALKLAGTLENLFWA